MLRRLMLALLAVALLAPGAAMAAEVRIAVASNFAETAKELAPHFERKTGHKAVLSIGPSGQLFAQIANGAPYDVFLSADMERPQTAEVQGLAVAGSRFTYATGRLVLWSRDAARVDGRGRALSEGRFDKLAIADPKISPYGLAAVEALRNLSLYEKLQPKLVQGSSIGQTYQFVETGVAEVGLVALAQLAEVKGGSRWLVPAKLHTPIDQQAVLLKVGAANPAARAFLVYLKSPEAKAVIRRYGYEVR